VNNWPVQQEPGVVVVDTCEPKSSFAAIAIFKVATCLENLEVSGNLTVVREMSGNCQETILPGKMFIVVCDSTSV